MDYSSGSKGLWLLFLPVFLVLSMISLPEFVVAATQDEGIDRGMHDKLIEPSIPNNELRSADKFWDEADRILMIGDIQAYGSYSDLQGDDLWGGSFYGLVAPGYKIGERMLLIAMYDGQYDRRMELYSDAYGYRSRSEFQRHAISPMLRIDFGDNSRYSLTPAVFYTWTWNKDESQDDSWNKGLYNYRDEGAGLDFIMRQCLGEPGELKIGAQYYQRRYPNFDVQLDTTDGGSYADDKNYHGIITKLEYSWSNESGFSWAAAYSLLYKMLDDKKVVNGTTGVQSLSREQRDYVHEMDVYFWYFFDDVAGGLNIGLDFGARMYDSNQNFLKFTGGTSWVINKDYFDFFSYSIGPNVSYSFELIPLTVSLRYTREWLDYSDRWTRDQVGDLRQNDEQWERSHELLLGLKFELNEKLSLMAQWDHLKSRSNNDDETVYVYDYRVDSVLLGVKYSF